MTATLLQERPNDCISDLAFDQWRAGELQPQAVSDLERHLAACESCRARQAELTKQAEAFLAQFPTWALRANAVVSLSMPTLVRGKGWYAQRWGAAVAALAVAAAVALVAHPRRAGLRDETRSKGSASFGFHVKQGQQVRLGAEGQEVHAGDQLRFFVSTSKPQHLAIFSRDGAGAVTEYYPGTGQSRAVAVAQNSSLDSSVELDSTLGQEELWAIFCDAPFATDALRQELTTRGSLRAQPGCSVDHMNIVKKAEP